MLEKTLESLLVCKEMKPVHPKGNQPEYSLEGLMLKLMLQYFGHVMQWADLLKKTLMLGTLRAGGEGMTEDEMVGWHEFEQTPGDSEGQGSLACCSPGDHKGSDMTERLNNNMGHCAPASWQQRRKTLPPEQGFPHAVAATVSRLVKGTAHWPLLEKDWGLAIVTAAAINRSFSWAVCDVQFQDEVRVTRDTVDWVSILGFFELQRKNCLIKNIKHNFLLMWPHWILIRKTSLNGEAQH